MARGRPRLYPADVARDGAPIFTLRLAPELLAFVREQGGGAFVRGLIEAEQARLAAEALPEEPEEGPVFSSGGPWAVAPAPTGERQRLGRAPGELWALVQQSSGRLVGLVPGNAEQARHLALMTQARFAHLVGAEQLEDPAWRAYLARLAELGLWVETQVRSLDLAPPTTPAAAAEPLEKEWVHQGWGVIRLMPVD